MSRKPRTKRSSPRTLLAIVILLAVGVAVLSGVSARAAGGLPAQLDGQLAQGRIFTDDLTVHAGEVIESNVVVYDGDATIERDARIEGNLVVYSGDIRIEEGAIVRGDVSAFSGDVDIAGAVGGNVASWSGDVELEETAQIDGDISVLSGSIDRADGASVGGNLVRGPTLNFAVPGLGDLQLDGNPDGPAVAVQQTSRTVWDRLGQFFFSLMLGVGLALLFVPLAALLTYVKPEVVTSVARTVREQTAFSFVLGLLGQLVLVFLTLLLVITICGILLTPVPVVLLIVLNFVGWTALALTLGQQIGRRANTGWSPVMAVLIGAVLIGAVVVPLWSLGGCFRFIVWAATFLVGATGVGAALMPWLERMRNGRGASPLPAITGPIDVPSASTAPAPPAGPAATDLMVEANTLPVARDDVTGEDDFTRISGIGQVFDARLKLAGVRTFVQLAALTPEQVAEIIGWPAERVMRTELLEQARALASSV